MHEAVVRNDSACAWAVAYRKVVVRNPIWTMTEVPYRTTGNRLNCNPWKINDLMTAHILRHGTERHILPCSVSVPHPCGTEQP